MGPVCMGMEVLQSVGRRVSGGFLIIAWALMQAGQGAAQNMAIPRLTVEEAVEQAVSWHPSVEEAIGRLDAQAEQRNVAKAGYLPQISGGIGSAMLESGQNQWRPRATLNASQMLYDFGKVGSDVRIAEAGDRVFRGRLLLAVDALSRDAVQAMIENQRAEALLGVAREQLNDLSMIEEMVRHRYQRGAATKSDALQAKGRVGGAEAEIQRIEGEIARWRGTLANLVGQNEVGNVDRAVPEWLMRACDVGVADWDEVPAMIEIAAERDRALAEYERSKADRFPTVSLEAGASGDVQEPWSDRADYNIGIRVSSSLFSGGAAQARARGAGHSLSAATAAEGRIRNDISRVVGELQQQVIGMRMVLETQRLREADVRETGSLYRLQYLEMGTRSLVDLLNSQQELHQLRFNLVNIEHDLRRMQSECLFYSGSTRDQFALKGKRVRGVVL